MFYNQWLKKLTALYECLAAEMNLSVDETHPKWLAQGWRVQIMNPIQLPASTQYESHWKGAYTIEIE